MQIRTVIRHQSIFTSPKGLANELGVLTRVPTATKRADYTRDFFMAYPSPGFVRRPSQDYLDVYAFYAADKARQRLRLAQDGLPVPETRVDHSQPTAPGPYVVRPLRHQGGSGFRVTTEAQGFQRGSEYISSLFPKTHEYRIIFVYGQAVVVLRKKANEGVTLSADQPWNHGLTTFQTIHRPEEGKLATGTDCFARLLDSRIVRLSHYCGVDILYNHRDHTYVVCEINSAPALTIDENRQAVADFIKAH